MRVLGPDALLSNPNKAAFATVLLSIESISDAVMLQLVVADTLALESDKLTAEIPAFAFIVPPLIEILPLLVKAPVTLRVPPPVIVSVLPTPRLIESTFKVPLRFKTRLAPSATVIEPMWDSAAVSITLLPSPIGLICNSPRMLSHEIVMGISGEVG